jgi:hypothetical protein
METKYITLGCDCASTYFLRKNITTKDNVITGPFDWADIPIKKLITSLNDFKTGGKDYKSIEIEKYSVNHPFYEGESLVEDKGSFIVKNKCGVKFAHEVLSECNILKFIETIERRIERFILASKIDDTINFIRYERPMGTKKAKKYFADITKLIYLLDELGFKKFKLTLILPFNDFKDINFSFGPFSMYVNINVNFYGKEANYEYTNWKNEIAFNNIFE